VHWLRIWSPNIIGFYKSGTFSTCPDGRRRQFIDRWGAGQTRCCFAVSQPVAQGAVIRATQWMVKKVQTIDFLSVGVSVRQQLSVFADF
jgi:hypothetical protein